LDFTGNVLRNSSQSCIDLAAMMTLINALCSLEQLKEFTLTEYFQIGTKETEALADKLSNLL